MAEKDNTTTDSDRPSPRPPPAIRPPPPPPGARPATPSKKLQGNAGKGSDFQDNSATYQQNEGPTHIENENKLKSNNLVQAKDRAQLTATTAMSVVHIALLRDLLIAGPENVLFYTPSLVLISWCLVLQIIAGAISMTISHMRSYYSKYQGNVCEDLLTHLCFCQLRYYQNPDEETVRQGHTRKSTSTDDEDEALHPRQTLLSMPPMMSRKPSNYRQGRDQPGCCPCYFTTDIFPQSELDTLDRYDGWVEQQLDVELEAAEARVHAARLKEIIHNAKLKLSKLETEKGENGEQDTREIKEMLDEAETLKGTYQGHVWAQEVCRVRGNILWKQSSQIREYHLLKMTTFWQHILNFIFYTVFVCNAFIMGMGVASGHLGSTYSNMSPSVGVTPAVGNSSQA